MENKQLTAEYRLFGGGDKVCKNCGQKKTLLSTYTCPGTTRKHVWVKK